MSDQNKQNILLILSDQQRFDLLGLYGNPYVQTPHIDALAAEGTTFTNAFTPVPICAAARASILTGLLPVHHGITRNSESGSVDGRDFLRSFLYFPELLREQGYECHHTGKWHVGTEIGPEDCGFKGIHHQGYGFPDAHPDYLKYLRENGLPPWAISEEFWGHFPGGKKASILSARQDQPVSASIPYYLAERTKQAIEETTGKDKPFLARIDFWGPHSPYYTPEPYFSMYKDLEIPAWKNFSESFEHKPVIQKDYLKYWGVQDFGWDEWQYLIRQCLSYTTLIDDQVGRIIQYLKDKGLYENTAIIYTSDHGGMVGAHRLCDKGPYPYDEILRIPFIARIPGVIEPGSRNDNYIYNYDVMPTFIELARGEVPAGIDAQSILPVIKGDEKRDRVMFAEFYGHQVPVSQRMIRTDEYKYIFTGTDIDEFYDLMEDPNELVNQIDSPRYRGEIKKMQDRLREHLEETGDKILRYYLRTRIR